MNKHSESIGQKKLQMAEIIFQEISDAILITEVDGRILDSNSAFEKMLGYYRQEVVGKNPQFLIADDEDSVFNEYLWKKVSTIGRWSDLITVRTLSGELLTTRLKIIAVNDQDGRPSHFIILLSDDSR